MKRSVLAVIIITVLFICLLPVRAEGKSSSPYVQDSLQAFGLHFGNVSGNGFAYRYFLEKVGFQAVLGGYSSGNNTYNLPDQIVFTSASVPEPQYTRKDKGRKYNLNLGLNAIYPLKRTDIFTFYLTGGMCWKYFNNKYFNRDYVESQPGSLTYNAQTEVYDSREVKSYVNFGFGPGVEIEAAKFFKLSIELPITYTGKHEFIMYVPSVGIYYYFR